MADEDRAALKRAITTRAHEVGFEKVGFAPASLTGARGRLEEWIARGYAGDMRWMERAPRRRTDTAESLPGAKTVVCLALNYYQGPPPIFRPGRGVISSYALGEDYHRVLEEKLAAVATFIESRVGVSCRRYVDTGPILEKTYAVAAGLGWQGKHSNLISRSGSSWFFLGEIVVPLTLPLDSPATSHCGTCTRCIEACPTRAIVEPFVVDSRLCISYLTIELRGPIPRELRPLLGQRIYGCDDCQDVCPWNRFAVQSEEAAFFPREPLATMDLVGMLRMSREAFQKATRGSAIRRARYAGFLRNVAVALGNGAEPETLPALVAALDHEEPLVRGHVAWAVGRIGNPAARVPLQNRRSLEADAFVLEEIEGALGELSSGKLLGAPPR